MLATESPPARRYGLGRYASELATALAAAGHVVHVVNRNYLGGQASQTRGNLHVHSLREALPLKHFHWVGDCVLSNVGLLARAMEVADAHGPLDVLLAHDWPGVLAAKSLKSICGLPLLLFMRDTEPGKRGSKLTREQLYIAEMETWACGHAEAIIANSDFLADELVRFHRVARSQIRVIPCGVNPARFEADCHLPDFRALFAAPEEKLVLFAGRLSPVKGVDLLIECLPLVLRRTPATRLVLAGEGALASALASRAEELGVAEEVHFAGHLPDKVLGAAYRAADVVAVPSIYEPLGLVALEAMCCGAPVVAADTGGLADLLPDDGPVWRCAPDDAQALARALCTALTAEPSEEEKGRLRSHAMSFTWGSAARAVAEVCRSVARGRRENLPPAQDAQP